MRIIYLLVVLALVTSSCLTEEKSTFQFSISFTEELSNEAQDGRLLLMLSNNDKAEPRFQIVDGHNTQLIFGVDVEGMKPGEEIIIDASAFGYPIESLKDVPAGEYFVQALINRYETFNLSTGHTVKLPPDKGEGQQWNMKPGNFYSLPIKIKVDPAINTTIKVVMDQQIPLLTEPENTKYIRHIKMQSKMLSDFWGRPTYLGAHVLVPEGFDEHTEARYPLMIFHGHFPSDFGGFSTVPPDPGMDTTDYASRFGIYGYKKMQAEEAYNFYQQWISKDFPRFLIIEIQHPTP